MKAKLYLETTIPSYLVGRPSRDLLVAAHREIARHWWESRRSDFELYVSEMVLQLAEDLITKGPIPPKAACVIHEYGYDVPSLCTPEELMGEEQ